MGIVYVVGTCDTKAPELLYAKQMAERAGARAVLVDVGTGPGGGAGVADVGAAEVAAAHPQGTAVLGAMTVGAGPSPPWRRRCRRGSAGATGWASARCR